MIRFIGLSVAAGLVLAGCASISSVDQLKQAQNKALENAKEAAGDADAKFFHRRFNKDYTGDKNLKKVAIVFTQVAWDLGKDVRNGDADSVRNIQGPTSNLEQAQGVVDAVYAQTKESLEKLGYTVVSPTELAQASATYKALAASSGVFFFSPTSGQEYAGLAVADSRYIHMMTNEGKLISKISNEAGIDAVVGLTINDTGMGAQETNLNKTFISGITSQVDALLLICVGKEQAKARDISTGWLGDANHCGEARAEFKNQYYLPWKNKTGEPEYAPVLEAGYAHLKAVYPIIVKGMIEELKEEGL